MATLSGDVVSFSNVQKSYPPGETLEVGFSLQEDTKSASRDWVGLFRVGWSSSRDYYTFEWVPSTNQSKGTVVFAGRRLPPEDKHFYQFCYVSSDGRVRGASPPFQFSSAAAAATKVEDLELVEVSEDSLMILQPKESPEDVTVKVNLEEELVSVKESVSKLEAEKEALVSKYAIVEKDVAEQLRAKEEEVAGMTEKVADLERQLQAKRDSETRLMEKLEKERALTHELTLAKTNEESQVALLQRQAADKDTQLGEKEAALASLQQENRALKAEVSGLGVARDEAEGRCQEMRVKIESDAREMNQLREMQVELLAQVGEKNQEIQDRDTHTEKITEELTEEASRLRTERDQLAQELAVAQQNIAELLGAKKEGVVVSMLANRSPDEDQKPPTLPATTQLNMVDKSAYEALQQAYENIEERYHQSNEGNRDLRVRLHDMKTKLDLNAAKNAELSHRVEKCREEYEAKSKEVFVLERRLQQQKQQGGGGGGGVAQAGEVAALQAKLREMEENQEQVTKSWEAAIQELAARKEEVKTKTVQVAEMDERVHALEQALQQINDEFTQFQDKHDHVMNEKAAKLDEKDASIDAKCVEIAELRSTVSSLSKEKGKLDHTISQLRDQLDSLKKQARSKDRACPVCGTKFPARISQQDFERHVQGHFNT